MTHRFFKLLYIFALGSLVIFIPLFTISEIDFDSIVYTTYRAKCISNGEYVVLQGGRDPYVFDEFVLMDTIYSDTKRSLNFYCKYYDAVQPHIAAYLNSKTNGEIIRANAAFFSFKDGVISNVYSYPELYDLEIVNKEFQPMKIFGPIISGLIFGLALFVILQIIRMSYLYVAFNRVVWNPLKDTKLN